MVVPGGSPTQGLSPGLRALWSQAEGELYSLATRAPQVYEHAVRFVRMVADQLAEVPDAATLDSRWDDRHELVVAATAAAAESGIAVPGIAPDSVAGAAFALRAAELDVEARRQQQRSSIEAARSSGAMWVVLGERGALDAGLVNPYYGVEMHLDSGLALIQSAEADPRTARPIYVLSIVQLDPSSGEVLDLDPGVAEPVESPQTGEHIEAVAAAKARIEAGGESPRA